MHPLSRLRHTRVAHHRIQSLDAATIAAAEHECVLADGRRGHWQVRDQREGARNGCEEYMTDLLAAGDRFSWGFGCGVAYVSS